LRAVIEHFASRWNQPMAALDDHFALYSLRDSDAPVEETNVRKRAASRKGFRG
jgi:hypothetical protein